MFGDHVNKARETGSEKWYSKTPLGYLRACFHSSPSQPPLIRTVRKVLSMETLEIRDRIRGEIHTEGLPKQEDFSTRLWQPQVAFP